MADMQNIDNTPEDAEEHTATRSRRNFIKKMVYAAPVIETFLLDDKAEAQTRGNSRNWQPRQNRRISPVSTSSSSAKNSNARSSARGNSKK